LKYEEILPRKEEWLENGGLDNEKGGGNLEGSGGGQTNQKEGSVQTIEKAVKKRWSKLTVEREKD